MTPWRRRPARAGVRSRVVADPRTNERLPRGPHNLSRGQVAESQRSRMIGAMIEAVAEKGYTKTTVGDVLKRAGVSRATFYEQFDDKADCFDATYRAVTDMLSQLMDAAVASLPTDSDDPLIVIDTLIRGYLDLMRQSPNLAKVFLVEVYATGPEGIARRRATLDKFVDLLSTFLADVPVGGTPAERQFTIRTLVVTLVALATEATAAGEVDRIGELHEPYLGFIARVLGPVTPNA